MLYTCNICKKIYNKKSNYIAHIQRKRPCIKIVALNEDTQTSNIGINKNLLHNYSKLLQNTPNYSKLLQKNELKQTSLNCKYCNKVFTRTYNLECHYDRCKLKKLVDEENNNKGKKILTLVGLSHVSPLVKDIELSLDYF